MPDQERRTLSAEEELAECFQAGLLTRLAGIVISNPTDDAPSHARGAQWHFRVISDERALQWR